MKKKESIKLMMVDFPVPFGKSREYPLMDLSQTEEFAEDMQMYKSNEICSGQIFEGS
jgi:hypothetical protein